MQIILAASPRVAIPTPQRKWCLFRGTGLRVLASRTSRINKRLVTYVLWHQKYSDDLLFLQWHLLLFRCDYTTCTLQVSLTRPLQENVHVACESITRTSIVI